MKKFNKKMNNNGSTFLFVVVALMFIALLAALILALTSSGYKMKTVDYNSRQNFYETEEYSGKIYAKIGMNALGILGESYTTIMGKLNSDTINNSTDLNDSLKELYYKQMLVYLRLAPNKAAADMYFATQQSSGMPFVLSSTDAAVTGRLVPMLKKMLEEPADPLAPATPVTLPELEIKGSVVCDFTGETDEEGNTYPTITINDVHIQYVDADTKYETNFTFDIVVRYPEWDFTYMNPVSVGTDIDTFLDYVLISTRGIEFDGVNESVYGCVGTGGSSIVADNDSETKGLRIKKGANVKFYNAPSYRYEPLEIVVVDNIVLESSAVNSSYMEVNDGDVWCNSILLKKKEAEEDELNSNGSGFVAKDSYLYVQDDLQLDGNNSSAQISGGSYIGYSNNTANNTNNAQHTSSAIIINGDNSKVNLKELDKMYVNGLAYIDYINRSTPYRTGESLSVKGNQDIYMVPDSCMGATFSNPVSASRGITPADEAIIAHSLLNNFFGASFLDPAEPYVKKSYFLNGKNYTFYYLNFSSPSAQAEYVTLILSPYDGSDTTRKTMIERVQKNLSEMNMTAEAFLSAEASTVYTAGALVTATGGSSRGSASATFSNTAGALVEQVSHINRYRLMKSLLMSTVTHDDLVNDFNFVTAKMYKYKNENDPANYPLPTGAIDNGKLNTSMVDNIINLGRLKQYVTSYGSSVSGSYEGGYLTYARVATGDVYTVNSHNGVLVVEGDVEITGNVVGLVIATGNITIKNSGTLTADAEWVDKILKAAQENGPSTEGKPRSDVFWAYPIDTLPPEFGESINQLQYSDVLYYDNWRNYEDTNTYTY